MSEVQEIVDKLIADITAGHYEPEDKLPSENELAELFRVPRMTARKAYMQLQERGFTYAKQGKGSYVRNRKQQIPLSLSGSVSFSKKMKELGYNYSSKNIYCEAMPYNERIHEALKAPQGTRVFRIGRLRLIDDMPIALHTSYVAEDIFPNIAVEGKQITSMFDYYESKGYQTFSSTSSTLNVDFPTREERDLLSCSSLVPLLSLQASCADVENGIVLELTRTLYRSDFFTYVIAIDA